MWKCGACRKQFSVLTGTIFHGTKVPLRTWLFVIYEMCANKNGIAAREIERKYEVTAKTAWFMLHRLREAMKRGPLAEVMLRARSSPTRRSSAARRQQPAPAAATATRRLRPASTARAGTPDAARPPSSRSSTRDRRGPLPRRPRRDRRDAPQGHGRAHRHAHHHTPHRRRRPYRPIGQEFVAHEYGRPPRRTSTSATGADRVVTTNAAEGYFRQLKRSHRRHAPPRRAQASAPLPGRVRLPLQHPEAVRLRPHATAVRPGRRPAAHLPPAHGAVSGA